jgi:type I restriction enzyme, S subunit
MSRYKLKDLLTIQNGKDYKHLNKGSIPVYGSGGLMTYVDDYLSDSESILLPRKGTLDNIMYVNGKFWTVDTLYWTKINTNIVDTKYLYFYLSVLDLSKKNSGSTLPSMTFDAYYSIDIELPSLDMQKKISKKLFLLQDKISLNNKINDNLQQQAKLLYDYWFNQFEFPNEEGKPYKSSGGKMIWNEELKREIPEGWGVENILENSLSTIIKPGIDVFDEKTYYATADVNGTTISEGSIINYENRESRANMQPTINSIWFAKMKNSIKHLYLNEEMRDFINNSILSTGFCGLQCNENSFEYLASFIEHSYFEILKDTLAHGATQEAVNNEDLSKLPLLIPSFIVLNNFHTSLQNCYKQISLNICENKQLSQLRDWLLPMLMNGQATVED